jgi:hypothetical protein
MKKDDNSTTDKILDLLLDALIERQQARQADKESYSRLPRRQGRAVSEPQPQPQPSRPQPPVAPQQTAAPESTATPTPTAALTDKTDTAVTTTAEPEATEAVPLLPVQLDRMLTRLALGLALLILIVNIPYNRFGTSLARAMPDVQSLIIRDGLVLKGSGEQIYVLENNQKRWITSLDAFEWHGYRWEQVNEVEDNFLNRFEEGRPIYVLLKCEPSPHIYALEDGQKRWIQDILTFEAEGFIWEDVKFVSCDQLQNMPNGLPFPPDAGPVPEP